jgi:hypothetical protein
MAAERKTGAGSYLSGVLERAPQPKAEPPRAEPVAEPDLAAQDVSPKGRGGAPAPKARQTPPARAAKRIKGRTVYIADDLFERIIVQAHRRDVTISDYICLLLDRHVPDHRVVRSGSSSSAANDQAEPDAA